MTLILDATAGYQMMWFTKNHESTVYLDKKRDVKPTIVADFRVLPFRDNIFDLVIFDPPHTQPGKQGIFYKKFGALRTSLIVPTLYKTSRELFRVLKHNHFLFSNGIHMLKNFTMFLLASPTSLFLDRKQLEKLPISLVPLIGLLFKKILRR